jgi:hypothetical protein
VIQSPDLTQLRTILVQLYPDTISILRVADDTDINHGHITTEGNIVNIWHALLKEAEKQDRLAALLAVAAADYPHNQELTTLLAGHQHALLPLSDIRLLNFAHPITVAQQRQMEVMLGKRIDLTLGKRIEAKFEEADPYEPQCEALLARIGFTPDEWKSLPILVNPPVFAPIAVCLLAELHGRMRHFPTVVRIRPGAAGYEVAEIINLQEIRDRARHRA